MGKSPGKWIKTLLFGKKSNKSRASKGRASAADGKDWRGGEGGTDLVVSSPVISEPVPINNDWIGTNSEFEKEAPPNLHSDGDAILPKDSEEQGTAVSNVSNNPERAREEEAAIKAQAAFRGYLARRAFRALKGLIRLQALIRGHLVRRQAVATLHCMWGIVKIQALIRGRGVKQDKGFEDAKHVDPCGTNLSSWKGKAEVNAFVRKLLSLPTVAKPLVIQYYPEESNSAWRWLERWSTSRFWKLPAAQKRAVDSKPHRRHYAMETESGRPKRSVRRNFGSITELGSNSMMTSESEKHRRNIRKVSSHSADPVQESPKSELEKVKRNLRKISSSMGESSDRIEVEIEKPKCSLQKVSNSTGDVLDLSAEDPSKQMNKDAVNLVLDSTQTVEINSKLSVLEVSSPKLSVLEAKSSPTILYEDNMDPAENINKDAKLAPDSSQNLEIISMPVVTDGPVDAEDHTAVELHPPENGGNEKNIHMVNVELNREEQVSRENHKASKRGASFLAKTEFTENGLQNTPMLPSYMAATESAKAKVRGQNSPRFSSDGIDKSAFTRRHSLPSSTNGRLASLSPRTQKLVPTSCKGGIKSERSLLSARDGAEKPIHVEWRR